MKENEYRILALVFIILGITLELFYVILFNDRIFRWFFNPPSISVLSFYLHTIIFFTALYLNIILIIFGLILLFNELKLLYVLGIIFLVIELIAFIINLYADKIVHLTLGILA